ncbi:MAG TPA: outer membrane protein assembly factor BamD [Caulobacteraceae bacterium]
MIAKFRGPIGLALIAAIAVSGCSLIHKKKPTLAYREAPVEALYTAGSEHLDKHQWNDAANYFKEVERQHPYSEWSRRAILMEAYAHYEANSYADAIADADRFITLYPGNAATPYAYYIKSICYFEQIVDIGRDQAATGQARAAFAEVIKRYPTTEYARDAKFKLDMTNDQLAGKEMTIGRYYLRAGDPVAAIGRFRTVLDTYQTTSHTPEALYRLVECYLTIGLAGEAVKNGAVLGYNFPGDVWYRNAYQLLTSRGLRPALPPADYRGPGLPRLLPWGRHKETTVAPPAVEVAAQQAGAPVVALAEPAPAAAPAKPKKVKDKGFIHGVLGL